MGIGVSLILIAAGAILTWAVEATVSGVSHCTTVHKNIVDGNGTDGEFGNQFVEFTKDIEAYRHDSCLDQRSGGNLGILSNLD